MGTVKKWDCIRRLVSGGEQPDGHIHGMQSCTDHPFSNFMMVKTEKRAKNDAKRKNGKTSNPPV